jgi:hypothetical protein
MSRRLQARPLALLCSVAVLLAGGCASPGTGTHRGTTTGSTLGSVPTLSATPVTGNAGKLHVRGAELVDDTGRPVLLRGAMMESSFAYIKPWQRGQDPTTILNSATFTAVASWHMNALRINISYWIYQLDPATYLSRLDQVVQQANTAGLYVILDFHDDKQSGSPYGDGVMHTASLSFWTILAAHYKSNPMLLFDPINEPRYADWASWLHGSGDGVVGYQDVIAAIRSTGAQQVIILEPGTAGQAEAGAGGWEGFPAADMPSDPNLLFSKHIYSQIIGGNSQAWDAQWGPILGHYPIFYGEWAVLPNALQQVQCKGLTSENADAVTRAFLAYLDARHANWTAWDFEPYHLIDSYISYSPTMFQTGSPWACGDSAAAHAGMGQDVKQFLAAHP